MGATELLPRTEFEQSAFCTFPGRKMTDAGDQADELDVLRSIFPDTLRVGDDGWNEVDIVVELPRCGHIVLENVGPVAELRAGASGASSGGGAGGASAGAGSSSAPVVGSSSRPVVGGSRLGGGSGGAGSGSGSGSGGGSPMPGARFSVTHPPSVTLRFRYPATYPSEVPPDFELLGPILAGVDAAVSASLHDRLEALFHENLGMACVYNWVSWLQTDLVRAVARTAPDGTVVVPVPVEVYGPLVTGDVESSRRAFEVTPQMCNACFEDHPGRDFVQLQTCPHMFCRTYVVLNPAPPPSTPPHPTPPTAMVCLWSLV
jgi:hypothetical protein